MPSVKCNGIRKRRAGREPRRDGRHGFTLVETALATVIIGTGVLAMISAHQVLLRKNDWSTMANTATLLGNEIREMTLNLPRHDPVTGTAFWGPEPDETSIDDYDDVDDFDGPGGGLIFAAELGNGPVNANRSIIPDMEGWEQVVSVTNIDAFDILTTEDDATTDMVRVEVIVRYKDESEESTREMTRLAWITPK